VFWLGPLPSDELRRQLATYGVGVTPNVDSQFNRASFPLKTLEYLSAGLGVVSTDMPAARWLDTRLISLHSDPYDFAAAVKAALAQRSDRHQEKLRKEFAAGHTWAARADGFQRFLESAQNQAGSFAAVTGNPGEEQS
jgi:teichuronic acid biosynthesis glycosyltransferase TuaH